MKLDSQINIDVKSLKEIRHEIKKIKFQLANLDTIFDGMDRLQLKNQSIYLYKTKKMLKEKRDLLVREENGKL